MFSNQKEAGEPQTRLQDAHSNVRLGPPTDKQPAGVIEFGLIVVEVCFTDRSFLFSTPVTKKMLP